MLLRLILALRRFCIDLLTILLLLLLLLPASTPTIILSSSIGIVLHFVITVARCFTYLFSDIILLLEASDPGVIEN